MGAQTMASQGGGGGGRQESQIQSLVTQGSLYSLTLNEVQSHIGEPLLSMNLDDLLKNVLPAAAEGNPYLSMDLDSNPTEYSSSSGLQRQGSITMSRAVSKKTVDEVWRDIQQGQKKSTTEEQSSDHERQPTLGEMTLEDFLVKAGVVTEGSDRRMNSGIGNAGGPDSMAGPQGYGQGPQWMPQYHHHIPGMNNQQQQQQEEAQQSMMAGYVPGRPVPQPLVVGSTAILDAVYTEGQVALSSPMVGAMSDPQTPGRKRGAREDVGEKTVERRQKRMIKNRESAARSRARKQAYTNELENKVSRLEEENERLKKQKELDKILHSAPLPEPKYQLRRSSSAPI